MTDRPMANSGSKSYKFATALRAKPNTWQEYFGKAGSVRRSARYYSASDQYALGGKFEAKVSHGVGYMLYTPAEEIGK